MYANACSLSFLGHLESFFRLLKAIWIQNMFKLEICCFSLGSTEVIESIYLDVLCVVIYGKNNRFIYLGIFVVYLYPYMWKIGNTGILLRATKLSC